MLEIEVWSRGAAFAYSIIYEYAFETILRESARLHEEFMIPAGISVAARQIGQMHNDPSGPYHMVCRHLNLDELGRLLAKGWTVNSRGLACFWRGAGIEENVAVSRAMISEATGTEVTAFVADADCGELVSLGAVARQNGYLSLFSRMDYLNHAGDDLMCLGRTPLIEEGPPPWRRRFDPYDRLALARDQRGWLVDTVKRVGREIIHPEGEITVGSLVRRFEKIREAGGGRAWCAAPEAVADYILVRRATKLVVGPGSAEGSEYALSVGELDPRVSRRTLTFRLSGLSGGKDRKRVIRNLTDRTEIQPYRVEDDSLLFDVEVSDGLRLLTPAQ